MPSSPMAWHGVQTLDPGKANLVLIHGAGGSGRFFKAQTDALTAKFNVLAVDLPNHGDSPGPACTSIAAMAQAVLGFIVARSIARPVIGGLSMGGAICQLLLAKHPGWFSGAVLISTGAKLKVAPDVFAAIKGDFEVYLQMVAMTAAAPGTDPAIFQHAIEDMRACGPELITTDFQACDAFDLRKKIPEIETPCLIINGDQDMLTPPRYSDWLEAQLPKPTRVQISGAGHLVSLENPTETNRAIEQFIETL